MSSGLQLEVRHHIQWRRHLVNAYEVMADMVFFAGQNLCDPCLNALEWFVPCKALYKCSDLPLALPLLSCVDVKPDPRYCHTQGNCHKDATCTPVKPQQCYPSGDRIHMCECNPGYTGDGVTCAGEPISSLERE